MCARPSGERRGGALARRGKPQRNGEKTTLCDSLARPSERRRVHASDARSGRRAGALVETTAPGTKGAVSSGQLDPRLTIASDEMRALAGARATVVLLPHLWERGSGGAGAARLLVHGLPETGPRQPDAPPRRWSACTAAHRDRSRCPDRPLVTARPAGEGGASRRRGRARGCPPRVRCVSVG
jgi:hypothetical protein